VAHDFNHVLAAIRLNADILAAGALGEFGPLQNITRAVAAGALLTKRISGLGTDRKAGNGSVCVNDAIYANNDLLISVLDDRFDLTFDLPDQSGWVGLSSSEMGCVLLNLVLNARNAMPEGGGIAIRVTRGRGKVVLRVSDEGAGFDRDRLRQLRSGVVPWAEDGRGIGFSIVAELVHSAGGLMTLRNHPGEGATVSISLPCLGKLRVLNLRKNTEPDIAFPATVN
jgi:C4-dicarboxylate-specific signal transduction histidine kinase